MQAVPVPQVVFTDKSTAHMAEYFKVRSVLPFELRRGGIMELIVLSVPIKQNNLKGYIIGVHFCPRITLTKSSATINRPVNEGKMMIETYLEVCKKWFLALSSLF